MPTPINLSTLFRKAWTNTRYLVRVRHDKRALRVIFAECLRAAWKDAKAAVIRDARLAEDMARVERVMRGEEKIPARELPGFHRTAYAGRGAMSLRY